MNNNEDYFINDNKKLHITKQDYISYQNLLKQVSQQRSISNYFFITINVLIVLTIYIFAPMTDIYPYVLTVLSSLGIILCIYWYYELRELYVLNEVRYRSLIELEARLFKRGMFNSEWERLGDYKFRRSPVFYISFAKNLPLIFIWVHGFNIALWFLIFKSRYATF